MLFQLHNYIDPYIIVLRYLFTFDNYPSINGNQKFTYRFKHIKITLLFTYMYIHKIAHLNLPKCNNCQVKLI